MPLTPRRSEAAGTALREALRELPGEWVRPGGSPLESPDLARLPTGVEAIDRALGGGFPRGRVSEIAGPLSSGRTSLALALLAAATRSGEVVAVVDPADAFDPGSAEAAGAALGRVLWVRALEPRGALRCAERLLEARGFGLVLLDLPQPGAVYEAAWLRLSRRTAASGTALLLLVPERVEGSLTALAVTTAAERVRFEASPPWLEGITTRIAIARSRLGPAGGCAPLLRLEVCPLACGVSARPGPAGRGGPAGPS